MVNLLGDSGEDVEFDNVKLFAQTVEPVLPTLSLNAQPSNVNEGEQLKFNFELTEAAPTGGLTVNLDLVEDTEPLPGDINYFVDGSENITDFNLIVNEDTGLIDGATVTIAEGATSATLLNDIIADNNTEGPESVKFGLADGNYTIDSSDNAASFTIVDTSTDLPTLSLSAQPTNVNEGEQLKFNFELTEAVPTGGLTVNLDLVEDTDPLPGDINYFVDGSENITDFNLIVNEDTGLIDGATVTIAEGATSATLLNDIIADNNTEGPESVKFGLADGDYTIDSSDNAASFTIVDTSQDMITIPINSIVNELKDYLNDNPIVFGSAVAFNPEVLNASPFVFRGEDGLEQTDIADTIDYTQTVWYNTALEEGEAAFSPPYFDVGGAGEDIALTTYSIPLLDANSNLTAVLTNDLLLADIDDLEAQQSDIRTALDAFEENFNPDANNDGTFTKADIPGVYTQLESYLNENGSVYGSAFAYNPDVLNASPFVFGGENGLEQTDIADTIDYTQTVWYNTPLEKGEAAFSVPYFDVGGAGENILLTTYSIPVVNETDSNLIGVLTSDLLLASFESGEIEAQQATIENAAVELTQDISLLLDIPFPTVGLNVESETVTEDNQQYTLTFNLSEPAPKGGLEVIFSETDSDKAFGDIEFPPELINASNLQSLSPVGDELARSAITIDEGATTASLTFQTVADGETEGDETTIYTLVSNQGYAVDADNQADTLTILDTSVANEISGTTKDDDLYGTNKSEIISGGRGDDNISGNGGGDTLIGGRGDDDIYGGFEADTIEGGRGDDFIFGNGGDDLIDSGLGFDTIFLGKGEATVILDKGEGYDTIFNFQLGATKLVVSSLDNLNFTDSDSGAEIFNEGDKLAVVAGQSANTFNSDRDSIFTV